MRTEKRERELVTRFDELNVGMLVVDVGCPCGTEHETFIIDVGLNANDNDEPIFICIGCSRPLPPEAVDAIDAELIAQGRIFRIVDGLDPHLDELEDKMDAHAAGLMAAAIGYLKRGGKLTRERL